MNKKKDRQDAQKRFYDSKTLLMRYVKRYGIVILIATVISALFCYVMGQEVEGFTSIVAVFSTLAIVLASLLLGMIIYNKIDEKEEEKINAESERDPFSE